MVREQIAPQQTRQVMKLEDLQRPELPIIEIEGRIELVTSMVEHDVGGFYTTIQRDNKKIVFREYKVESDGTVTFVSSAKVAFNFYDPELRRRGL